MSAVERDAAGSHLRHRDELEDIELRGVRTPAHDKLCIDDPINTDAWLQSDVYNDREAWR